MKIENQLFAFGTISHKSRDHSILEPWLFLTYVNDTPWAISSNLSNMRRYALVLFRRSGTIFTF